MKKNYIFGLLAIMLIVASQISAKTNVTNYILNPGFEADNAAVQKPTNWGQWLESGTAANLTLVAGDAHSGSYYCKMQGATAYKVMSIQSITGLPAGTYSLSGWFRSSGGQNWGNMSIKNYGTGSPELYAPINSAMIALAIKKLPSTKNKMVRLFSFMVKFSKLRNDICVIMFS